MSKPKKGMTVAEMQALLAWCAFAPRGVKPFWERFLLAAHAYDLETQQAMFALAQFAMRDPDKEPFDA